MHMSIKLLAMSKDLGDSYFAMVSPCLISDEHPLYSVNDVFNAVFVHGNMLGDSMYYGRGAGKLPTASAVVSDVIDCARHMGKTVMCFWDAEDVTLTSIDEVERRFFVRVKEGNEAAVKENFGDVEVIRVDGVDGEYGFVTESMKEIDFAKKSEALGDTLISRIRMEA